MAVKYAGSFSTHHAEVMLAHAGELESDKMWLFKQNPDSLPDAIQKYMVSRNKPNVLNDIYALEPLRTITPNERLLTAHLCVYWWINWQWGSGGSGWRGGSIKSRTDVFHHLAVYTYNTLVAGRLGEAGSEFRKTHKGSVYWEDNIAAGGTFPVPWDKNNKEHTDKPCTSGAAAEFIDYFMNSFNIEFSHAPHESEGNAGAIFVAKIVDSWHRIYNHEEADAYLAAGTGSPANYANSYLCPTTEQSWAHGMTDASQKTGDAYLMKADLTGDGNADGVYGWAKGRHLKLGSEFEGGSIPIAERNFHGTESTMLRRAIIYIVEVGYWHYTAQSYGDGHGYGDSIANTGNFIGDAWAGGAGTDAVAITDVHAQIFYRLCYHQTDNVPPLLNKGDRSSFLGSIFDDGLTPGEFEPGNAAQGGGNVLGDVTVEDGDFSNFIQCALLTEYIMNYNVEANYWIQAQQRSDSLRFWSDRLVPVWSELPEKFINYLNFARGYSGFFMNLELGSDGNFHKENDKFVINNKGHFYNNLGVTPVINYVYKSKSGIRDIPITLNSSQGMSADFLKLRLASEVKGDVGGLGAKTNSSIEARSGGMFKNAAEVDDYLKNWKQSLQKKKIDSFYSLDKIKVKFAGTSPSTAKKDVEVEMQWVCDGFNTFMSTDIATSKPKEINKITLADLTTMPNDGKPTNIDDPGSWIRGQYSPDYNRLQLILKTDTITSRTSSNSTVNDSSEGDGGSDGVSQQNTTAIGEQRDFGVKTIGSSNRPDKISLNKRNKKNGVSTEYFLEPANDLILDLAIIDHTVQRDPATGYLTYTVNYRGYFSSQLTSPACDALADETIYNNRQLRESNLKAAAKAKCSRVAMKRIISKNNTAAERESKLALQSIIKRLTANGQLYEMSVSTKFLKTFIGDGRFDEFIQSGDKSPVAINWERTATAEDADALNEDGTAAENAEEELQEEQGKSDIQRAGEDYWSRMKDFYTTGRPLPGYEGEFIYNPFNHLDEFKNYGAGKSIQTYCFFLGDLIQVVSDGLYQNNSSKHRPAYKHMNMKFMTSNFLIPNFFDENASEPVLRNIASVPISIDFFVSWFNETVANKKLLYYPVGTMIKDLVERVIGSLLFETCVSAPTDTPPLFRIGYFSDCRRSGQTLFEEYKKYRSGGLPFLPVEDFINKPKNISRPLFVQDNAVPTSKRQNYVVIYCLRNMVYSNKAKTQINNDKDSYENYIPIINYGTQYINGNYISDVKFSKTSTPGLREARYFAAGGNGTLSLLSTVYDLSFSFKKMAGNTLFYPGQLFDFRLLDHGLGSPHNEKDMAYILGFGGYHLVTRVTYNLSSTNPMDFSIDIDSKFVDTRVREGFTRITDEGEKSIDGDTPPNCDSYISNAERFLTNVNESTQEVQESSIDALPPPPPPQPQPPREETPSNNDQPDARDQYKDDFALDKLNSGFSVYFFQEMGKDAWGKANGTVDQQADIKTNWIADSWLTDTNQDKKDHQATTDKWGWADGQGGWQKQWSNQIVIGAEILDENGNGTGVRNHNHGGSGYDQGTYDIYAGFAYCIIKIWSPGESKYNYFMCDADGSMDPGELSLAELTDGDAFCFGISKE